MTATWATIESVLATTGKVVSQTTVDQAEASLEPIVGVIAEQSSGLINKRDLYWLKQMCAYQAAWLADQPDYFTRSDIISIQQDGTMVVLKPDGLILAPMAKRASKRLSWRGTRTITPSGAPTRLSDMSVEERDNAEDWQDL